MGFLQLISADKLSAVYHINEGKLVLTAEGRVQDVTSGEGFIRQPFPCGLKFNLEAWVGPLTGKSSTYKRTQEFNIPPPIPKEVYIVTANYPNGKPVPVELTPEVADFVLASKTSPSTTEQPQTKLVVPEMEKLVARIGVPFNIKQAKNIGTSNIGDISISYDDKFLLLKNASIQGQQIVWTFDPVRVGVTEIVVFVMGTVENFVLRIPYQVEIVELGNQPVRTHDH